jgi:hypothetical protein
MTFDRRAVPRPGRETLPGADAHAEPHARREALLQLQQSAGNAAVARLLTIGGKPVSEERITRQSAYKRRLNAFISSAARDAGFAPEAIRRELVLMTAEGSHAFGSNQDAVEEAVRRRIRRLVGGALKDLKGSELSQEEILKRLQTAFGGKERLHTASRHPEFADVLLESIRTKQSTTWQKATEIHQAKPSTWTNDELQHWSARHYTSKCRVILGTDLGGGKFTVQDVLPPPFMELLSSITLATMDRGGSSSTAYKTGDSIMMSFSSGAATSGHTTGKDWKNIGNVGDTFYGLFYKNEPATGKTPAFIRDGVYYATWPVTEFGDSWTSSDWLASASKSQVENAEVPSGKARRGELSDIIADIFPEAATRDLSARGGRELGNDRSQREDAFSSMENFEVKKHGPMKVKEWLPVPESIERIKGWKVNTNNGKFLKLPI